MPVSAPLFLQAPSTRPCDFPPPHQTTQPIPLSHPPKTPPTGGATPPKPPHRAPPWLSGIFWAIAHSRWSRSAFSFPVFAAHATDLPFAPSHRAALTIGYTDKNSTNIRYSVFFLL